MRHLRSFSRRQQLIFIIAAALLLSFIWTIQAPDNFPVRKQITINDGDSLSVATKTLDQARVIKIPLIFKFFAIIFGGRGGVKAGDYWFETKLSAWTIAKRLVDGQFVLHPTKVTIPEGSSPAQIAKILLAKFPTLDQKVLTSLLEVKPAENFPDTYFWPPEITAEKIVDTLNRNFRRQTASLYAEVLLSGRKWEDILTMSSLVEEEASNYETRQLIAGILWKRLDVGMPLQVDVARVTYAKKGLPEMAIVNPGLEAIRATIHPTVSEYWYYLSDAKGETHYAADFAGHKANRQKYLR